MQSAGSLVVGAQGSGLESGSSPRCTLCGHAR